MIKRDHLNIIIQHNADWPLEADGGDSAARTGIMALCGSKEDQALLNEFVVADKLIRHPGQPQWCTSDKTSRDQLIQWAAGVFQYRKQFNTFSDFAIRDYADDWFINKDFLPPDVKLYLHKCINMQEPLWLKILGYPNMFLSLLWSCFVMPSNETNQMICMCSVYGKWWLRKLAKWHPNLNKSILDYWGGHPFRDQIEIADALIAFVERETR